MSRFFRKAAIDPMRIQSQRALVPNGAAVVAVGMAASTTGTLAALAADPAGGTNTRFAGVSAVTSTSTGQIATIRGTIAKEYISAIDGQGGFAAFFRGQLFGTATVADRRSFMGFHSSTSDIASGEPSALASILGIGNDSTEANLSVMHNDGSGTATKIDLGVDFPSQPQSSTAEVYELALYVPIGEATVEWWVQRLSNRKAAWGTITTNLPAVPLVPHLWTGNGGTGAATICVLHDFKAYIPNE